MTSEIHNRSSEQKDKSMWGKTPYETMLKLQREVETANAKAQGTTDKYLTAKMLTAIDPIASLKAAIKRLDTTDTEQKLKLLASNKDLSDLMVFLRAAAKSLETKNNAWIIEHSRAFDQGTKKEGQANLEACMQLAKAQLASMSAFKDNLISNKTDNALQYLTANRDDEATTALLEHFAVARFFAGEPLNQSAQATRFPGFTDLWQSGATATGKKAQVKTFQSKRGGKLSAVTIAVQHEGAGQPPTLKISVENTKPFVGDTETGLVEAVSAVIDLRREGKWGDIAELSLATAIANKPHMSKTTQKELLIAMEEANRAGIHLSFTPETNQCLQAQLNIDKKAFLAKDFSTKNVIHLIRAGNVGKNAPLVLDPRFELYIASKLNKHMKETTSITLGMDHDLPSKLHESMAQLARLTVTVAHALKATTVAPNLTNINKKSGYSIINGNVTDTNKLKTQVAMLLLLQKQYNALMDKVVKNERSNYETTFKTQATLALANQKDNTLDAATLSSLLRSFGMTDIPTTPDLTAIKDALNPAAETAATEAATEATEVLTRLLTTQKDTATQASTDAGQSITTAQEQLATNKAALDRANTGHQQAMQALTEAYSDPRGDIQQQETAVQRTQSAADACQQAVSQAENGLRECKATHQKCLDFEGQLDALVAHAEIPHNTTAQQAKNLVTSIVGTPITKDDMTLATEISALTGYLRHSQAAQACVADYQAALQTLTAAVKTVPPLSIAVAQSNDNLNRTQTALNTAEQRQTPETTLKTLQTAVDKAQSEYKQNQAKLQRAQQQQQSQQKTYDETRQQAAKAVITLERTMIGPPEIAGHGTLTALLAHALLVSAPSNTATENEAIQATFDTGGAFLSLKRTNGDETSAIHKAQTSIEAQMKALQQGDLARCAAYAGMVASIGTDRATIDDAYDTYNDDGDDDKAETQRALQKTLTKATNRFSPAKLKQAFSLDTAGANVDAVTLQQGYRLAKLYGQCMQIESTMAQLKADEQALVALQSKGLPLASEDTENVQRLQQNNARGRMAIAELSTSLEQSFAHRLAPAEAANMTQTQQETILKKVQKAQEKSVKEMKGAGGHARTLLASRAITTTQADSSLEELDEAVTEARDAYNHAAAKKDQLDTQIIALNLKIPQKEQALTTAQAAKATQAAEVARLQAEVTQAQEAVRQAQEAVGETEVQIVEFEQDIRSKEADIEQLQAQIEKIESNMAAIQALQAEDNDREVNAETDLDAAIQQQQQGGAAATDESDSELDEPTDQLQAQLMALQTLLESAEGQLAAKTEELETLQATLDTRNGAAAAATTAHADADRQQQKSADDIAKLEAEKADLEGKNGRATTELQGLDLDARKAELDAAEQAYDDAVEQQTTPRSGL